MIYTTVFSSFYLQNYIRVLSKIFVAKIIVLLLVIKFCLVVFYGLSKPPNDFPVFFLHCIVLSYVLPNLIKSYVL